MEVTSSGVGEYLHAADPNATSAIRATDIEIDRGVSSPSVTEYKTHYADTLDARWFGAMFMDGFNVIMFDRQNVRQDKNIGLGMDDGRFCGDGTPGRRRTYLGLICLSLAIRKRLGALLVSYTSCGMLTLLPIIEDLISAVLMIHLTGFTF